MIVKVRSTKACFFLPQGNSFIYGWEEKGDASVLSASGYTLDM